MTDISANNVPWAVVDASYLTIYTKNVNLKSSLVLLLYGYNGDIFMKDTVKLILNITGTVEKEKAINYEEI